VTGVIHALPSGSSTPAAGGQDATAQVRGCIAQHGLAKATDVVTRKGATVFAACVWPAPSWADQDGYSEIVVRDAAGPGTSEASGIDLADRIGAPCSELEVAYSFGKQGAFQRLPPFSLLRGQIATAVDGQQWRGEQRALPFYPDRNEAVVLRSSSYRLDFVRCVTA
jgi:hypothetical protein